MNQQEFEIAEETPQTPRPPRSGFGLALIAIAFSFVVAIFAYIADDHGPSEAEIAQLVEQRVTAVLADSATIADLRAKLQPATVTPAPVTPETPTLGQQEVGTPSQPPASVPQETEIEKWMREQFTKPDTTK